MTNDLFKTIDPQALAITKMNLSRFPGNKFMRL